MKILKLEAELLTADRLRELLTYDPQTGFFRWRVNKFKPWLVGHIAGTANQGGYWHIGVDRAYYKAHRLAWLYVHGCWPASRLDHANADPLDNRIENLRETSHSQNIANSRLRRDNRAGLKGVCYFTSTGKWGAIVSKDKQRYYLGQFESPELAHEAYAKRAAQLHGQFARNA